MVKIEKILFTTDFSENSTEALKYATSLAEKYGSCLHIVHVTLGPNEFLAYSVEAYIPDSMKKSERASLEANLKKLPPAKYGSPKSVKHKILEGLPFPEILTYIKKNNIDLVVMGTHGRTGLKHMVMGSVSENVVRSSTVPVLTVHTVA